jgi:hypothetical protein
MKPRMKPCTMCGAPFNARHWGTYRYKPTGAIYWKSACPDCEYKKTRAWRENNKDKVSDYERNRWHKRKRDLFATVSVLVREALE